MNSDRQDGQEGTDVVFVPDPNSLEMFGLGAPDALLRVTGEGKVFIPVVNYQQQTVHLEKGMKFGQVEMTTGEVVQAGEDVNIDCGGGGACGCSNVSNRGETVCGCCNSESGCSDDCKSDGKSVRDVESTRVAAV